MESRIEELAARSASEVKDLHAELAALALRIESMLLPTDECTERSTG